jgi:hypothetical protein
VAFDELAQRGVMAAGLVQVGKSRHRGAILRRRAARRCSAARKCACARDDSASLQNDRMPWAPLGPVQSIGSKLLGGWW